MKPPSVNTQQAPAGPTAPAHSPERRPFAGVRITHRSDKSLDAVVASLRAHMGVLSIEEATELGRHATSVADFEAAVTPRLGDSGFVLMQEIDHGAWLKTYGIDGRSLRWIFGNPLIAVTLIRPAPVAGLFAPLELLLADGADGGSVITYVQPSSQIVIDDNEALRTAATGLDAKVEGLIGLALA